MNTADKLHRYSKPFWVPAVCVFYLLKSADPMPLVLAALAFGYAGDLLLMSRSTRLFAIGASSFLCGHLLYTAAFIRSAGGVESILSHPTASLLLLIPYAVYAVIIRFRIPGNGTGLYKAAIVYFLGLLLMSWSSTSRLWNLSPAAFITTLTGTVFFIFSDTVIGYRVFVRRQPGTEHLAAVTYIAAQLLITAGLTAV